MTKKEKLLYKSGRKNPNGYPFSPFDWFKKIRTPVIIFIVIVTSLTIELLNVFGVMNWSQISYHTGIVSGAIPQESSFAVYYLDVGQSDCTIVVCDDEVMMIDTGTQNQVYSIRTSLFTLDINEIDYMVVTHQHSDHMNGAYDLISYYDVKNILMPKLSEGNFVDSIPYKNLLNNIAEHNVNPVAVSSGYSFKLGSALVEVLSPSVQDDNLNNMSVVLKITYGDTSFLFQGDAEKEIEKQLLRSNYDLKANVLKVGHHGSDTSSQGSFLKAVNPDFAVVSAGIDNTYGHPNYYAVDRLIDNNIELLSTSFYGNITITSDGSKINVIKEKDKLNIFKKTLA